MPETSTLTAAASIRRQAETSGGTAPPLTEGVDVLRSTSRATKLRVALARSRTAVLLISRGRCPIVRKQVASALEAPVGASRRGCGDPDCPARVADQATAVVGEISHKKSRRRFLPMMGSVGGADHPAVKGGGGRIRASSDRGISPRLLGRPFIPTGYCQGGCEALYFIGGTTCGPLAPLHCPRHDGPPGGRQVHRIAGVSP
jgi:hypothetical protein